MRKIPKSNRRLTRLAAMVVVLALLLVAPWFVGLFGTSLLILILILGLFALSHDLLLGQLGLLSLGHTVFFAGAAYGVAILQVEQSRSAGIAIVGGLIVASVLALAMGFFVRVGGVYFILVTLALGIIFWGTAHRWTTLTRGDSGITRVEPPDVVGVHLMDMSRYYYVVLGVVLLCLLMYHVLVRSPFGLSLRGIRESERRMQALGYSVFAHKYVAFVLSGMLAGVAGVLYVYWNRFVSPAAAELVRAAEAIVAVALGGSGTLLGPFIGAAIVGMTRHQLSAYTDRYLSAMGVIFILTAIFASRGLLGYVRSIAERADRGLDMEELVEDRGAHDSSG